MGIALATAALAIGAGIWALRQRAEAPAAHDAKPRALEVVPLHSGKADPATTPATSTTAVKPNATALPLTAASPDEPQLRGLLQAWLDAKTAVLAGKEPAFQIGRAHV